jgi:hypothetical protein
LQAVEPRALQPDVEKHESGAAHRDRGERVVAVLGRAGLIALVFQDPGYEIADIGFVVDDQNLG